MAEEVPRTTRDPRAERPCPACGERRRVAARRHKVLGAWVPEWDVLPCRNPDCALYEPPEPVDPADPADPTGPADPAGPASEPAR
ncbi:hypothetical protein AB0C52_03425 [Streptomyces sp. NPDC048717]|uniref:hypothetical protein n=1 Tax=Streptomyces sp. NPDC048717 TaxID=3154928 RepID=UPI003421A798